MSAKRKKEERQVDQPGALVIGGDFQGLGVLQSLSRRGVRTCVVDSEFSIARFSRHRGSVRRCPDVRDDAAFLRFLMLLARNENLQGWVLYANNDETVRFLSRNKQELEEFYRVPVPRWETAELFYDKRLTYALAQKAGVSMPATYVPKDAGGLAELECDFPVIVKPAIRDHFYHQTKRKAVKVDDRDELVSAYRWACSIVPAAEVMVQEFIPAGAANLFSLGVLFADGRVLAKVAARRARQHPMDFGHATTFAETVQVPELEELGARILQAAGYCGLAEVEFMRDPRDGTYRLLEVNGRVWGWHTLARAAGVDFPYLLYRHAIGLGVGSNGTFPVGVKWVRPITDMPTASREILRGNLGLAEYFRSLRGCRELAPALSRDDPIPFFAEFVMAPYLLSRRGF